MVPSLCLDAMFQIFMGVLLSLFSKAFIIEITSLFDEVEQLSILYAIASIVSSLFVSFFISSLLLVIGSSLPLMLFQGSLG